MTARVSIGNDIRQPALLSAELVGTILTGIGAGRWAESITRLRMLPYHSADFATEKEQLAYWTPSGLFRHRSAGGLVQHSGHVALDLDNLGEQGATRTIQAAVADRYCLCGFRSASGRGVRLVFRCPPSAAAHKPIFDSVVEHVRSHYGVDPDLSGSDVARACFVSYDNGMWLNRSAVMLPGLADLDQHYARTPTPCVVSLGLSQGDRETLAWGVGESRAPHEVRDDGTLATHLCLRDLARDLVVRFRKHALVLTEPDIERALGAWWETGKRRGDFRRRKADYHSELLKSVRAVEHWPEVHRLVNYWLRWTKHPDFPAGASADERLEWVVRHHCAQSGDRFFLSARDAATITATHFVSANQSLRRLVRAGVLARVGEPLHARHAQTYRLLPRQAPMEGRR
jgi:hypothetical protein